MVFLGLGSLVPGNGHSPVWSGKTANAAPMKPDGAATPYSPRIAPASNEGELAISRMRVPAGLRVQLFAAEPMLANPVAFCLDEQGRIYVAETFRQKNAVVDNRDHMFWLDDDLAAMTVEDRLAYYKKHLQDKLVNYTKEQDRIRLLEDRDGDGKADRSTVFADGFNDPLEGTGAGVLARNGQVWYTNIPKLWLLQDENGDGQADTRTALHHGYGVRVAFRGHDLHGLTFGPDGRLYFSVGDRGMHVVTPEGKTLAYPDQGTVLRCNPDGSELEVFAQGLRNPQELAFDQYGNLFTGDNNSDSGDQARWVYVVEGGDSGWRMSFQYLFDRGPWNREKLWHPQHEGQPAHIIPPIANLGSGPSGLAYYPGTGLPDAYQDHFFLCDFRGAAGNSGVRSFAVKPKGAGFELTDSTEFLWSTLVTDVAFGPDSAMYVSDWVEGWDGPGKGRIYKVTTTELEKDPVVLEVSKLISTGMRERPLDELGRLLGHANLQVRQAAQFELAERADAAIETLAGVARKGDNRLARLHAIWGLGQIGRKVPQALQPIVPLLRDPDAEVRAQVAKVAGDERLTDAAVELVKLLTDSNARVRYFAALSLGKLKAPAAVDPLIELLRANADGDVYIRHAAVFGLAGCADAGRLIQAAVDASPAVRMGVLLAMRRTANPTIARFLSDAEPRLVDEAARAINDLPIPAALPQLAALGNWSKLSESTLFRVINANFRIGRPEQAATVALLASRSDVPERLRIEAVKALGDWTTPSARDRVLGLWRPLEPRAATIAVEALRSNLGGIFAGPNPVRQVAAQVATQLGIKEVGPALYELFVDGQQRAQVRIDALKALGTLQDSQLAKAIQQALTDDQAALRAEGRRMLASTDPAAALPALEKALQQGEIVEQQVAFATLAEMQNPMADELLSANLDRLLNAKLPAEITLDLLEAAGRRNVPSLTQKVARYETARGEGPLAAYREALAGGNAERGRAIFLERAEVSCVRCHKIGPVGGEVGPELSRIAAQQSREYLLEAIVDPSKQIAKGFDTVILVLDSGKVHSGIIKADDGEQLTLMTPEGVTVKIQKNEIDEQARGKSGMPEDLVKKLSKSELRDLVEFLAGLK